MHVCIYVIVGELIRMAIMSVAITTAGIIIDEIYI